jgi:hypothetical protein
MADMRAARALIGIGISFVAVAVLAWFAFAAGPAPGRPAPVGSTGAGSTDIGATTTPPLTTPSRTAGAPSPTPTRTTTAPRIIGGKPGPANTGVPPGTKLTIVNGDRTFSSPGTYSNLDIHGFAKVTATGVTIKDSIFRGGAQRCNSAALWIVDGASATVEDSEVVPANPNPCLDGVWATNVTLLRVDIHGSVDGIKAFDHTTVEDSYVHDLSYFAHDPNQNNGPTHNDAVQTYEGNQHILLRHNTFVLSKQDNAAYQVTQDGGRVATDLHVESNWLDGGGCTLNFAHKGGPTPMTGIYVVNNRFGRDSYYNCPILVSTQTVLSSNTGNVWDDTGQPIPPPQRHD